MTLVALSLRASGASAGADVSSTGNWTKIINAGDLAAGAGSNLLAQYESGVGVTTVTISGAKNAAWRVLVRRADGTWHPNFTLRVRRISGGSGSGTISGGTSYIQLSSLDTELFSGSDNRNNISVQYQLSGVSLDVAPNTYSAGVIFTLALL